MDLVFASIAFQLPPVLRALIPEANFRDHSPARKLFQWTM